MREVGVRELKNGLSGFLRSVERGEVVRITVRGRAIADLVPASLSPAERRWRQLVADGRITPASAPLPDKPPPLGRAGLEASALILEEREHGR